MLPGIRTIQLSPVNYWSVICLSKVRLTCATLNGVTSAKRQQHREQMTLSGHDGSRVGILNWTPDGRRLLDLWVPASRNPIAHYETVLRQHLHRSQALGFGFGKNFPLRFDRATDIVFSFRLGTDGRMALPAGLP